MNFKPIFLVLLTLFINCSLFSQVTSTWVSGSNGRYQSGTYGTKGTAASSNVPGARTDAVSWVDGSDNLWLFGGTGWTGGSQGTLNDLWKWDGSSFPLPVDLVHFDAQPAANHTADLHWATASEINNNYFDVERSYNGKTFETVGHVDGNGSTNQRLDYNFMDESIRTTEMNVFYRLKQVDFDGVFEYSDVRVVRFDGKVEMLEIAAYPNPFSDEVTVMVSLSPEENYNLQVTNFNGTLVHQEEHTFTTGMHTLDLSQWNSGMYIVEVVSDRGTEHIKVMKK